MTLDKTVFDEGFGTGNTASEPIPADDLALPVSLETGLVPIDRDGFYVPNRLDESGTVHFFTVVDVSYEQDYNDLSHELRYFRASKSADGQVVHDSHPVMPMDRAGASPFPLPTLQMMLEEGDLTNAQELAYHTAQSYGFNFPDPDTLMPLNPEGTSLSDIRDDDTEPLPSVEVDPYNMVSEWADAHREGEANAEMQGAAWFEAAFAKGSTPEPGSWEELIAAQTDEPEPDRHYWQMDYRPVETPEGEQLGIALFVTEFPQLPPDFDDYIEETGNSTFYPTRARTLEMAHFANEIDAAKFDAEFRGYLVPGLLDGPELAPDVAKLEGLSGEWQDMDHRGIMDTMSGSRTVVREADDWHLHNPNAEREALEQFENPQTDIEL